MVLNVVASGSQITGINLNFGTLATLVAFLASMSRWVTANWVLVVIVSMLVLICFLGSRHT